jgi:hypothetical protein
MDSRATRWLRLACLVTIAGLLIAACGEPSTEDFVAEADAICQKAEAKQDAAAGGQGAKGIYGPNFSDEEFLGEYNAAKEDALKQLKQLEVPEAEKSSFEDLLAGIEESIAAVEKRIASLKADNQPEQSEAQRDFEASFGSIQAAAGAVGLSRCQALGN